MSLKLPACPDPRRDRARRRGCSVAHARIDQYVVDARDVGVIVRAHHERWDGGGYPDGLAGEAMPLEARIIACCDAGNAMTTTRSYRAALSEDVAAHELLANAGTQFDPEVVVAVLAVAATGVPSSEPADELVVG